MCEEVMVGAGEGGRGGCNSRVLKRHSGNKLWANIGFSWPKAFFDRILLIRDGVFIRIYMVIGSISYI